LAMIFSSMKRERANSKTTEDHDMVNFDAEIAAARAAASTRESSSIRASKDEEYEDKRKSKNLTKVPSKLKILFGMGAERPHVVAMTDEMVRLDTVIQSEKGRKKLIDELLAMKGAYSVMVRFCYAVDQFDNTIGDEKERTTLAQSLIDMFLRDGGKFHITLSEARKQAILEKNNHNQLLGAKHEVLEELSKIAEVMSIVDIVEAMDGV